MNRHATAGTAPAAPTALTGERAPGPPAAAFPPPFDAVLAGMPHPAWVVELRRRRVCAVNPAATALLRRSADTLLGQPAEALAASPEDLAWWAAASDGETHPLLSDTVIATADGRALHVSRSIGAIQSGAGLPTHALVVLCDRSAAARERDERDTLVADLQATLEATADGILVTDPAGRVRAFNRRFAEMWAMPLALLEQRDDAAVQAWMARSVHRMGDGTPYDARLQDLRHAVQLCASDRLELHSGHVLDRVTRPLVSGGRAHGRVWSFRDQSDRVAAEERIEALGRHDLLTGLPNRQRLADCVHAAGAESRRDGSAFGLLIVDLDRFRQINDSLGHAVGDQVLMELAQRMQSCLRRDDVLARLGGDQFALLLRPADAKAAEATARRVLNVVAQPCSVDGAQFTITCSIGIALAPAQGWNLDDLSRHADAAMRAVKAAGRANYRLHQNRADGDRRPDGRVDMRLAMRLDHAMRQALVSGRFRLHYQPQVEMDGGRIVGAEALLRWRDPELGELSPAQFIPVAEDSGFIVAIGDWVLSQAVRQAALWASRGHALPIAINVSALQFRQAHFVDRVASVLAVSGLPPRLLELELTESILVHDADEALHRLHALERLGVAMSIDDFGTGYSSLAYLKRFPIRKLKIDRSFVGGLPGDDSDAGIVRAILQMAQALGMRVVAEGVETEAQRQFLHDAGCQQFQGYLFAPALDSLSFEQRLGQARTPDPAPGRGAARMRLVSG